MDISIIVLTYNAREVTLKMLDSLRTCLSSANFNWEVIVVDNDSTDGIRSDLENMLTVDPWFRLVKNENNGFAKGNNLGVKESDSSSKYVLFLNPDIILEKNSITIPYEYMELHSDVALTTCKVDLWSGGIDWDCHRGFPTPWRSFCYFLGLEKYFGAIFPKLLGGYHLLHLDLRTIHEIDACIGAYMLIRRDAGKKINWWSEDYFLNGEDIDLCYQLKVLNSGKIIYNPESRVIHYKGASKGTKKVSSSISKASGTTKKKQIDAGINSMKIFYRKYYEPVYPKFITQFIYWGISGLKLKRRLTGRE